MTFDLIKNPECIADAMYTATYLGYHHPGGRRPSGKELAERICSQWRRRDEASLARAFSAGEFHRKIGG